MTMDEEMRPGRDTSRSALSCRQTVTYAVCMFWKGRCKSNFAEIGLEYAYVNSVRKYKGVQLTSRIITAPLPVLLPSNILPTLRFDSRNENFGAHLKNTSSFIFKFLNSRSLKFRKSSSRGCITPELLWKG